jgi:putative tryptophan/tyrosine transport system substrate-binding protein
MIQRRAFITLLVGAAAWPVAARAQQRTRPVVGYLHSGSPEPRAAMIAAFRQGLKEAGYVEGQNVDIEYRWAEDQLSRLPILAAELVAKNVAVVATGGGDPPAQAAQRASAAIPIVFVTSDPVKSGLVANLHRPGGNLTGVSLFTLELGAKRLGLLFELAPKAVKIAALVNPMFGGAEEVRDAAKAAHRPIEVITAHNEQEIDAAFTTIGQIKADALLVISSPLFTDRRHQIVTLANYHRIPAIYPLREYSAAGGLISYGTSIADAYRLSGVYTGRILDGAKPNVLPVLQPTKFDLAINLKTARALSLEIPPTILALADEVIE